ncbi:MAG: glycosyltransferase family 39 protein [Phycisphaerae bacterium]
MKALYNMSNVDASSLAARPRTRDRFDIVAAALIVVVYVGAFLILPHRGFWINDNGCKFIQLQGLIENDYHRFTIPWPGQAVDASFEYNPLPSPFGHVVDGELYGAFSPVFPLSSSFPFRVFGPTGLYLLPVVAGLLTLPAVWLLVGRLSLASEGRAVARSLATLIVALGTPMWFYSLTFWEHTPAACLVAWAVLCYVRYHETGAIRSLAVSALLAGLAVYFRDELYLFGAVLLGVTLIRGRDRVRGVVAFASIFVLVLGPLWWFQWSAIGHPLGHHFRIGSVFDIGLSAHLATRLRVANLLLVNVDPATWLSIMLAAPYLAFLLVNPTFRNRSFARVIPVCASIACLTGAIVLARHLTADRPIRWLLHANGLFAASPFLLLAFVGVRRPLQGSGNGPRERASFRPARVVWMIILLHTVLYVALAPEGRSHGIHWGCRYLLPVYPLIGALTAVTVSRWWTAPKLGSGIARVTVVLALALSISMQVYSLTLLNRRKAFSAELNRAVAERPEEVIVASGWYVPQELAFSFFDKQIFLIETQEAADRLIGTLKRNGTREVLFAVSPPTRDAGSGSSIVVGDGSLKFISVELQPVRLTE